ncbi:MAG: hypothetical protein WCK91_03555, partial [bacterium]
RPEIMAVLEGLIIDKLVDSARADYTSYDARSKQIRINRYIDQAVSSFGADRKTILARLSEEGIFMDR